jgi:hypothetical protein
MNKHTHRTSGTVATRIILAATLALCSGFAGADEVKSSLLLPWEADGKVYEVAPKTLMFVGEVKGTLYAESGQGPLDGASMVCPMLYEIDVEGGIARGEGRCAIVPKGGAGVVYAVYSCQGDIGSCAGRLDLSGGTGRFAGVNGSGPMSSRTGAVESAVKVGPGGDISRAEGLMTLRGFSYHMP